MEPTETQPQAEPSVEGDTIDMARLQALQNRLEAEQSLAGGVCAGLGAALAGAAIWAVVTVATQFQIGWMAVGVGFVVGHAVRVFGKGVTMPFGLLGAGFALAGCILGNLMSVCGFVAKQESIPVVSLILSTLAQPKLAWELLRISFQPLDLLFYGIALYEGYKFSFRRITRQELADALTTA